MLIMLLCAPASSAFRKYYSCVYIQWALCVKEIHNFDRILQIMQSIIINDNSDMKNKIATNDNSFKEISKSIEP